MRRILAIAAMAISMLNAQAQSTKWINNVKLSGYGMVQYQYTGRENAKSNSFNLRMARIALDGRILKDWYWKAQIQFNGNTSTLGSSQGLLTFSPSGRNTNFSVSK